MSETVIRELLGFEELRQIYPLVAQSNPEIGLALFEKRMRAMLDEGQYRCIAAYLDGRMVGVAGLWTGTALWCGKYIEPDNVVVDRELRSGGIGAAMMAWIEAEARQIGCEMLKLEAYAERTRTRDFYKRQGYGEPGVVMIKTLPVEGGMTLEAILEKGRRS